MRHPGRPPERSDHPSAESVAATTAAIPVAVRQHGSGSIARTLGEEVRILENEMLQKSKTLLNLPGYQINLKQTLSLAKRMSTHGLYAYE